MQFIKTRNKIDLEMKMDIILKYETSQNLSITAREFNLPISTVNTIVKDATRIKEHVKGTARLKTSIITKQRSGAICEMEKLLVQWIEEQKQRNLQISPMMIQAKAREIFEEIKGEYPDSMQQTFVASKGWFHRFKNRSGIYNNPTTVEEKLPNILKEIIEDEGYFQQQIFYVQETGLFWKKMPSCTDITEEESFATTKDKLTLLLGCNVSGCCKLKPLVVYHTENPRALEGISKDTLPVYYRTNSKISVSGVIFEDWFVNCFIPEVEEHCTEQEIPFKILLILDQVSCHPAHLDDFHQNIKVIYLPTNTSNQSLGQNVITNFQVNYLRKTFAQATSTINKDPDLTVQQFWKAYSLYHGIVNIATAWQEISKNSCLSIWKAIFSQVINGSNCLEKDKSSKDVVEKIIKLAKKLALIIEVKDILELIESHDEQLTDEDFIELEKAKSPGEEIHNDNSKEEQQPKQFIAEEMSLAFREIKSGMARLEKMDANKSRFLKVKRSLDESLACYREIYEKKKRGSTGTSSK